MNVQILLTERAPWRRIISDYGAVWLAGTLYEKDRPLSDRESAERLSGLPRDPLALEAALRSLDGLFAAVVQRPGVTIAIADHIASIPLLLRGDTIAGSAQDLFTDGRVPRDEVDADAARTLALSGFTLGEATLARGTVRLPAGGYTLFRADGTHRGSYLSYTAWDAEIDYGPGLEARLETVLSRIIQRAIARADGRWIVVPLSAGLDSRLIASGLKAHGYAKVKCFAYGQPGHHDALASRQIASRLGYSWAFVPHKPARQRAWVSSEEHAACIRSGDALSATPSMPDYAAIVRLRREGWVTEDSLVVNGQSGDFLSGNHIPATLGPGVTIEDRGSVIDALLAKHHSLWRSLWTHERLAQVRRELEEELDAFGAPDSPGEMGYALFEAVEHDNVQSKYVLGGQRVYECLGLDWALPLWDRPFVEFWKRAPLEAKFGQKLYAATLGRLNWGGVWHGIEVRPRTVPRWVQPVRLGARALAAPLGPKRWHAIDRRLFTYATDPFCSFAHLNYAQVVMDRRGFRNALSWSTEDYLSRHDLGWDGSTSLRNVS
jgi:asparagine synthase (glutamine-hydrolysing)